MLDFLVDTNDLAIEFSLSKNEVDDLVEYCVEEVTSEVFRYWSVEAKQNLSSTRDQYLNALSIENISRTTKAIFLNPTHWLPNAIEQGASSFDMKKGFLTSNRVKYTKNGTPYLTIAFRFTTPETLGENSLFSGVLPTTVFSSIQRAEKERGRGTDLRLSEIPKQYHIPVSNKLRATLKSKGYESVSRVAKMTSIYEGISRQPNGSGYVNFRRVSLSSQRESWVHPGFDAKNFANAAESKVSVILPNIVDNAIDEFLSNLGF